MISLVSIEKPASRRMTLFQNCLALSLAVHGLLFLALGRRDVSPAASLSAVEIDLTKPFGGGPAKLAAPKRMVRPSAPPGPAHVSAPIATVPNVEQAPWVRPSPPLPMVGKQSQPVASQEGTRDGTQTLPSPGGHVNGIGTAPSGGGTADGAGLAPKPGGFGDGAPDGMPGGTGLGGGNVLVMPKLLNREELLESLRRFYPERERRAGHEGRVVVALHIGANGRVFSADILQSAGADFDGAAQKVAGIMRFSPAMTRAGPAAVKIKQTIFFRLTE